MKKKEQTDSMVITLENAIYMGMKNDLAFIIDTELFLYEHQSTYNPNMPLRDLFYISSEYQKLVDKKSLYSSVLQKIPAPQFIVFYNGTEKKKDKSKIGFVSFLHCSFCIFFMWFFKASKLSLLITCSMRQASSTAVFSETPSFIRQEEMS